MKHFIGIKEVDAKPMTRGDYNKYRGWQIPADENPEDEGYLVKYSDSYESWSPKEAFDKAGISAEIDSDTGVITLNTNILYAFDDAALSDEGKEYLDSFLNAAMPVISETIQEGIVTKINVEGHTDTEGEFEYNQTLSEDRAQSVVEYIVSQYPELESTITSKGYSFLNPILKENGEVDMEASRRVEFRFVLKTGS